MESTPSQSNYIPFYIENAQSSLTIYPSRGGIVTSLKLQGKEILYQGMLDSTLHDNSKSVKGGIPILFPNAGPLTEQQKEKGGYTLPQHGFARNEAWKVIKEHNPFIQELSSQDVSDAYGYGWQGKIVNTITLNEESCEFLYELTNDGDKDLPLSMGLHPYFDVPSGDKSALEWNFSGGEHVIQEQEKWSNDQTTKLDMPSSGAIEVIIPKIGKLRIESSKELRKLWIWSLPGRDFVCIEPMMNHEGGLIESPVILKPHATMNISLKISLSQSI